MRAAGNIFTKYDEEGRVLVSNQVYDHEGYDRILHDLEWKFIQSRGARHANPSLHFVSSDRLSHRPTLSIQIDRPRIKAGGNEHVRISGIPKGCEIEVTAKLAGQDIILTPRQPFDGPGVWLPAPAPGLYCVTIRKWPYRDWVQQFEGIEG